MNDLQYIQTGKYNSQQGQRSWIANLLNKVRDNWALQYNQANGEDTSATAREELEHTGLSRFQLALGESRHIGFYLHADDHVRAALRGHIHGVGGALVIATDTRILYLHEVPLFSNFEEFPVETVKNVSIDSSNVLSSIRLDTTFKTYQLDYVSTRQAERFLTFVESKIDSPNAKRLTSKSVKESSMIRNVY